MTRVCIAIFLLSLIFGVKASAQGFERSHVEAERMIEVLLATERTQTVFPTYQIVVELHERFEKGDASENELEKTLQVTLQKNFDRFCQQSEDVGEAYQAKLLSCGDRFVDEYVSMLMHDVLGNEVPEMEAAAFGETCVELGLRMNIDYSISFCAPNAEHRRVVLSLPNMASGDDVAKVKFVLNKLDGVQGIEANVFMSGCQFFVPKSMNIRQKLDEFAETTKQFEGWGFRLGPLKNLKR